MSHAAMPETATASEVHDLASAGQTIEKIIRREASRPTDYGAQVARAYRDKLWTAETLP